ncbi:MAG TPA: prolipoprotein diacylglyceryl transferase [Gammaproteobacteria bacterium]|nr:prolipoprotein diacylglyceryl transferase [Gammaproteobacteria bacterium]
MSWPSPIALQLGPVIIYWYGIAYLASFFLCYYLAYYSNERQGILSDKNLSDYVNYAVLGVVLGGRFGYVIFYHPDWVVHSPIRLLMLWQGGMSFHGGLIGYSIATLIFCRKYNINVLRLMDHFSRWIPIGLFLGRLANFINQELPGRVTDVSWGIIYPRIDGLVRHPSQLYEAFFEGVVLFIIINLWDRYNHYQAGSRAVMFISLYAVIRFFLEYFREPDFHLGYLAYGFTMGQWLSLLMIMFSIVFTYRVKFYDTRD